MDPDGDKSADQLDRLGVAALQQYDQNGDATQLDNAIHHHERALRKRDVHDPLRSNTIYNLASALVPRYWLYENAQDLQAAIENHRAALSLRPVGHPNLILSLANLATILVSRYQRLGNLEDLDEAIGYHRMTLALCPQGHESRWIALNNLGLALKNRFFAIGDRADFEEACSHHREALELTPPGHPSRHTTLNSLASALISHFQAFGDLADLDEALKLHRATLELRPQGHPFRSRSLANIGIALSILYEQTGKREHISAAIDHLRQALVDNPDSPSQRAAAMTELGNTLFSRHLQLGERPDLDEAIQYHRESLLLRPLGDSERPKTLTNLSRALGTRHRLIGKGDMTDLDEAIAHIREANELCPVGHSMHPDTLALLGNFLMMQFRYKGDRSDLDEALSAYTTLLELTPGGTRTRPYYLEAIAAAMQERYKHSKDTKDIDQAIHYFQEAYDTTPDTAPWRSDIATSLAHGLVHKWAGSPGEPGTECWDAMLKMAYYFELGARQETAYLPLRVRAARAWVEWAEINGHQIDGHPSLRAAYAISLDLLAVYVTTSSTVASQHARLASDPMLHGVSTLACDAAAHSIHEGAFGKAIQQLEQGRLLILNQLIRYQTPVDDLRAVDPDLAEQFEGLSLQIYSLVGSNGIVPSNESERKDDSIGRHERLSAEWGATLQRIRQLDGFGNFLRPTSFDDLREAASEGPVILVNISQRRSDAFILLPGDQEVLIIPLPDASPKTITGLSEELQKIVTEYPQDTTTRMVNVLRKLWDIVVMMVTVALERDLKIPRRSRVWWCLTSAAWSLPFHAAGQYRPGTRNFADRYISSYTSSLSSLIRLRKAKKSRTANTVDPRVLVTAMPQTLGEPDLPSVFDEVARIKAVVKDLTVLQGPEATREAVLTRLRDHSWAHFACHGHQDHAKAFDSHFSLYDKRLSQLDIIGSGVPNAQLAILSACHSSEGDRRTPDEAVHLAAGMQFAGFDHVVGTMWSMADDDGPVIAEEFYRHMFRNPGQPPNPGETAEALSVALASLRRKQVPLERCVNFVHYGP